MKPYLYGAIVFSILIALTTIYGMGYSAGKRSSVTDRISILKDGKRIDEKVYAADDNDLFCMVFDCVPD